MGYGHLWGYWVGAFKLLSLRECLMDPTTLTDQEILAAVMAMPDGYAKLRLKMDLHPIHTEVLNALFSKEDMRISFRAGNNTGKTSSVVATAILYGIEIRNCLVVATSGVYRQITGQMIPAIKRYSHLFPGWEFLENCITINGVKKFIAFSNADEGAAQGWHSQPGQPLLVILDEAGSIGPGLYLAIERCHPTYMLVTGSPLDPAGMFYDIETKPEISKDYQHFLLPATECTISKGYWIKDENLEDMIGRWGKDSPLVLSSIYAQFSKSSENSIISFSALDKCLNANIPFMPGDRQVGIDLAAGRDENVLMYRCGNMVKIIKAWHNKDTMAAVGECIIELNKLKESVGLKANEVYVDSDGLGLPCAQRMCELGWHINMFHGGSSPSDKSYKNKIAECWIEGAKRIVNCNIILPNDPELKSQLLNRKQKINSSGTLQLESKEDAAKRGISSPDRGDALMLCLPEVYAGLLTSICSGKDIKPSYRYISF
jgi:hypothetical protein